MILNPNKTKALVVLRSWTVSSPHGDLVLSGVSIRASPNLDILGVEFDCKLTFEDHVRGIVSRVSQRIGILRLIYFFVDIYLWTPPCYSVAILYLFSQSSSIVLRCWGQLLNVGSKCIRWPGFEPIRVYCHCVIDVVWLGLVCCTRLIRTLITVCSVGFHLLQLDFDIS